MDQKEQKQLYGYDEHVGVKETDRYEAAWMIEATETKYQQHMAFTTNLPGNTPMMQHHEEQAARELIQAIQDRRADAEIYAVAVHQQGENGNIHLHVVFGTDTTLRRDDLTHFREVAYQLEKSMQEQLKVLQLNHEVKLREQVNREGTRLYDEAAKEGKKVKLSGKEPELDLNDLRHPPQLQQSEQVEQPTKHAKQRDRDMDY